jgi:hypothetical protein
MQAGKASCQIIWLSILAYAGRIRPLAGAEPLTTVEVSQSELARLASHALLSDVQRQTPARALHNHTS